MYRPIDDLDPGQRAWLERLAKLDPGTKGKEHWGHLLNEKNYSSLWYLLVESRAPEFASYAESLGLGVLHPSDINGDEKRQVLVALFWAYQAAKQAEGALAVRRESVGMAETVAEVLDELACPCVILATSLGLEESGYRLLHRDVTSGKQAGILADWSNPSRFVPPPRIRAYIERNWVRIEKEAEAMREEIARTGRGNVPPVRFAGRKVRLAGFEQIHDKVDTQGIAGLWLILQETDYKDYQGTNCAILPRPSTYRRRFDQKPPPRGLGLEDVRSPKAINHSTLANPLSVGIAVITSDNYLLIQKRNIERVGSAVFNWAQSAGGFVDPDRDCADGFMNPFHTAIAEFRREIGEDRHLRVWDEQVILTALIRDVVGTFEPGLVGELWLDVPSTELPSVVAPERLDEVSGLIKIRFDSSSFASFVEHHAPPAEWIPGAYTTILLALIRREGEYAVRRHMRPVVERAAEKGLVHRRLTEEDIVSRTASQ